MKTTIPILKKALSIVLCFALLLGIVPSFAMTAHAASVVPYNFTAGNIYSGTIYNVGDATEKVDNYFLLDSTDAQNGFSITFQITTNNSIYSQFLISGYNGIFGQYNTNAVSVTGGDDGWKISYPQNIFNPNTKQTITFKTDGEVRGQRTICIPIRSYDSYWDSVNQLEWLYIHVFFYDSSVTTADISKSIRWTDFHLGTDGGSLEYSRTSPESSSLYADWSFADSKYMSATYQWYKETNGSFTKISGATSQTYKPDGRASIRSI